MRGSMRLFLSPFSPFPHSSSSSLLILTPSEIERRSGGSFLPFFSSFPVGVFSRGTVSIGLFLFLLFLN